MKKISRIETAVEFLKDGLPFEISDLRLGPLREDLIFITGWSKALSLKDLTKSRAMNELSEIQIQVSKMLETSENFRKFIKTKKIKYNLAFKYGMGSIGICSIEMGFT